MIHIVYLHMSNVTKESSDMLISIGGYKDMPLLLQNRYSNKCFFSIIIIILGFVNGILCLITFKNKITCESGCGIYRLCSSVITILTMIIFILKIFDTFIYTNENN